MSKVEELRNKYPISRVTNASFNKFNEADFTPTKKYLEFMVRAWSNRDTSTIYLTIKTVTDLVKKFDELLPYITNKDIYHKDYNNMLVLRNVVEEAERTKEEKTFNRDEHSVVLMETDEYLLLQPITHRGSLKYGAGTKWCTASKNNPEVFKRYTKNGYLIYLIDKTGKKDKNYCKVALYSDYNRCPIGDDIVSYNVIDSSIGTSHMKNGGWNESDIFNIFTTYRYYFMKMKTIKKDKDTVDNFVNTLSSLNFEQFEKSLSNLDDINANTYTSSIKEKVDEFLKKLNNTHYAIR